LKLLLKSALLLLVVPGAASLFPARLQAQTSPASQASQTQEKQFLSGGRIEMQLEGGDYEVRPAADDRIRVTLRGNTGGVKVTVNTNGTHADVTVKDTPHNDFHAIIEVPATSDLRIRLTAGNLITGAIKGDKDIESNAGNAAITTGDPKDYARVDASVHVGNLNAESFEASKNGFFRSFKWSGQGKYTLHASLGAGNLTLHK